MKQHMYLSHVHKCYTLSRITAALPSPPHPSPLCSPVVPFPPLPVSRPPNAATTDGRWDVSVVCRRPPGGARQGQSTSGWPSGVASDNGMGIGEIAPAWSGGLVAADHGIRGKILHQISQKRDSVGQCK